MTLHPVEDRIVVRAHVAPGFTDSGIFMPETIEEVRQEGTVLATGPGRYSEKTGARIPHGLSVGDVVLFSRYAGTEIPKHDVVILRAEEVQAVLELEER